MKNVIAGLEEGLQAIAEALEGGSGQQVPAPVAADNGKVLKATGAGQVAWQEDATGAGVPTVTSGDDGKVLTADYTGGVGTYSWEDAPSGVPDTSQVLQGSVLAVGYSGDPEWENITDIIPEGSKGLVPTTTGVTNGYVLTNNNGTPAWAAASGGGGGNGIQFITGNISSDIDDKEGIYYAGVSSLSVNVLTPGTYIAHFNTPAAGAFDADSLSGISYIRFGYNLTNYIADATYTIYPISVELRKYDSPVEYSFCVPTYADRSNSLYNQKYIQYVYDSAKLSSGDSYVLDVNCIIVVKAVE